MTERVDAAGGMLDHRHTAAGFRLFALLPATSPGPPALDEPADDGTGPLRVALSGVAAAALVLVVLPAGLLLGVSGR